MARMLLVIFLAVVGVLVLPVEEPNRSAALRQPTPGAPRPPVTERPAGTLVAVSDGNRLLAIDVATGRRIARRMRALASCAAQLVVTGGHVVFAGYRGGRTVVLSLPLSLTGRAARLGAAHAFVASATPGRVWLAGTRCTDTRMAGVREVAVDGRVTEQGRRHLRAAWVAGATDIGLVVHRRHSTVLWDPNTGREERLALGVVTDVQGRRAAGCPRESGCAQLVIADLATGGRTTARPRHGYEFDYAARLSPEGTLLAAPASRSGQWRIALVDTATGGVRFVRRTQLGGTYPELSWSASSGWLFFRGRDGRLGAVRPGSRRAVELPFRLPRDAFGFAAG